MIFFFFKSEKFYITDFWFLNLENEVTLVWSVKSLSAQGAVDLRPKKGLDKGEKGSWAQLNGFVHLTSLGFPS